VPSSLSLAIFFALAAIAARRSNSLLGTLRLGDGSSVALTRLRPAHTYPM
jgi:hypothetical protein